MRARGLSVPIFGRQDRAGRRCCTPIGLLQLGDLEPLLDLLRAD
jgi:hypothetical protein